MDTDETTQVMYSTGEVAKRLGVGPAMVRRWALAYEKMTGDTIKLKSKRDGRYFTAGQLGTISTAKTLVDSEGVKIETALKMVMGESQLAATIMTDELEGLHTSQALEAILARTDETNRLLLEEIRGLRQDVAAPLIAELKLLRVEVDELKRDSPPGKINNPVSKEAMMQVSRPGIIVRFATWFESLLRR